MTEPARGWSGWLLMLLALLLLPLPGWADELAQGRSELEQIRQRIEQTLSNLASREAVETSLLTELAELDRQLRRTSDQLARLEAEVRDLREREAAAERAAEENRQRLHRLQSQVEHRLVALYKEGEVGLLRVLFSRSRPAEMAWQHEYLTRILRHDRQLLGEFREEQHQRNRLLEELATLRQQRQQTLAREQGQRQLLWEGQQVKAHLLTRSRKDQQLLQGLLDRLERQAGELQALVKRLESEKSREYTQPNGPFAAEKGRLPWPAPGTVLIGYGRQRHPELGTPFDSRGLELKVQPGIPVRSVWSGRVVFADRFAGYGNLVIVDHGDGFHSLYARLGSIARQRGDLVERGATLGVTDAEDARLYLEIRTQGAPADPQSWLGSAP